METVFFQSFWVNTSENIQLFKIYMIKSHNDIHYIVAIAFISKDRYNKYSRLTVSFPVENR